MVCGRYDFRGVVLDSGGPDVEPVREGPDFEVLRACRPRGTTPCTSDTQCAAGEGCLGAPNGVCARRCTGSGECATRFCFANAAGEACQAPGVCAAVCDDNRECPTGWYCQFSYASNTVQGRCAPWNFPDAGCPARDAGAEMDSGAGAPPDATAPQDAAPLEAAAPADGASAPRDAGDRG
jgi:hypothetical protein